MALGALALLSCGKKESAGPLPPAASPVGTLGTTEVTARLVEIPGAFPPNKLYDYVYVLKYQVLRTHRGKVDGDLILVGHYNPLKPRSGARDKFSGEVGGTVERFQVGEVHRMALAAPLDQEMPMVGLIDKYAKENRSTRYWAIWTDRGGE